MWKNKSNLEVKCQYFLPDGLHLTPVAKEAMVIGWIENLMCLRLLASMMPYVMYFLVINPDGTHGSRLYADSDLQ